MERQHSFRFADGHRLPIEPRDPSVEPVARPRLGRQSLAVLERLREGPATNVELASISHRFGGRLYDLRRAGCVIATQQDHPSGIAIYTLKHEPEGLTPPSEAPSRPSPRARKDRS
jgi:hypothetical protein